MTPAILRTRLRMALREVSAADQAEILGLALAFDDRAALTIPDDVKTPAGARQGIAMLARLALRGEGIDHRDVEKLPRLLGVLAGGKRP